MDLTKDFSEFIDKARTILDSMDKSVGEGIYLDESCGFTKKHADDLMLTATASLMSLDLVAKLGTISKKED